jgi:hypothetical protein
LRQFFINNRFQFGEEHAPTISPGRSVTALMECLKSYYETYSFDTRQPINYFYKVIAGKEELSDKSNVYVMPDRACSHAYLIRYYPSIFFAQLYLELSVVDLLDRVSPGICREDKKERDWLKRVIESPADTATGQTIQFSAILERLRIVLNDSTLRQKHDFLSRYLFLLDNHEILESMRELRNDIVHSGQKVLFHYSYEVLFVNYFLPVVRCFIAVEENTIALNRNLHCGLNVLEELCRFRLPEAYLTPFGYEERKEQLHRVNHFKELGRASLKNPLFMGEFGTDEFKRRLFEDNRFKVDVREREARVVAKSQEDIHTCPVCGGKTFLPNSYNDGGIPYQLTCLICSYTVEDYIGEPARFGIMKDNIFQKSDERTSIRTLPNTIFFKVHCQPEPGLIINTVNFFQDDTNLKVIRVKEQLGGS